MLNQVALLALALSPVAFAQISDGFESGWDQTKWPIYAPDCNQGGTVSLDSTTAHSGKNSMKVTGGSSGYCGHIFFGTTAIPSGDVYVRTWLKTANAFGSDHVTFITNTDASQSGKHLRVSGQMGIVEYNRESDDATLPDLSPQGVASSVGFTANTWTCLEYHIGTDGTIETWVNDKSISGLNYGPKITNPYSQAWSRSTLKPKITGTYFGWEAYGGQQNTFWYDDIVISGSRVGCSGSGSTGGSTGASTSGGSGSSPTTTAPSKATTTKAGSSPATTTSPAAATTTAAAATPGAAQYAQCGGTGWSGATSCQSPYTCKVINPYYSQCT